MSIELVVRKGHTFIATFLMKAIPNGSSYESLIGYKYVVKVRPSKYSSTELLNFDETSVYMNLSGGSEIQLTLPDTYTDTMDDFGDGVLNIWLYDPSYNVGYKSEEYNIRYQAF